jgi:hypothetical protein
MRFFKKNVKDLDSWIGKSVKAVLNNEGSFYIGVLKEEQKNGILIEANGKMIYIPYESVLSIEEI